MEKRATTTMASKIAAHFKGLKTAERIYTIERAIIAAGRRARIYIDLPYRFNLTIAPSRPTVSYQSRSLT